MNQSNMGDRTIKQWPLVFLMVFCISGCATAPTYDPFRVPRSQVHGRIKTIALSPVSLPRMAEKVERVKDQIELLIATRLKEAGYRVLPSMEFGAIWDRFIDQVGGIFDPITGKADEAKIKIVRDHTRREMTNRFKADAVLHPSVQVVGAHVKGFRASWDGTAEEIVSDGWYRGFEQGTTQALSLIVLIEDVNGADLYAHRGGIQLISKTVRGRFVNIAASQILTREDQIVNAVNIVLNPFLEKQEPQGR